MAALRHRLSIAGCRCSTGWYRAEGNLIISEGHDGDYDGILFDSKLTI